MCKVINYLSVNAIIKVNEQNEVMQELGIALLIKLKVRKQFPIFLFVLVLPTKQLSISQCAAAIQSSNKIQPLHFPFLSPCDIRHQLQKLCFFRMTQTAYAPSTLIRNLSRSQPSKLLNKCAIFHYFSPSQCVERVHLKIRRLIQSRQEISDEAKPSWIFLARLNKSSYWTNRRIQ